MPFELKLAFRYFHAKRKSLARFTSFVAVAGIAAGVASLILANALARGFSDEMRDKILANTPHIAVFLTDETGLFNWRDIAAEIKSIENVETISPVSFSNAIILGEDESSYAILKVDDRNREIDGQLSVSKSQVAIGKRLAEKLKLEPGKEADLLTVENQTPTRIRISAIFETGLYDYDSTWIYISPEKFAQLSGRQEYVPTTLSVSVKDIYASGTTAEAMRKKLGAAFKIIDWQEANRPLFAALSLERKVAFAVIALIVFIAALNITTTLTLNVGERRLDIAILRTCGASARAIVSVFLLEGVFLGLTGIAAGIFLGVAGCFFGNRFRLISLPAEVYELSNVPFSTSFEMVAIIALAAFILCIIATIYPAFAASRIKPSENLRTL